MNHERSAITSSSQWYAVHCRTFKERQLTIVLKERLDVMVYLPEVRRRFRKQTRYRPFFPGYIFIYADLEIVAPSHINATPGVLRLVSFSDLPQPIPVHVIEALREQVADFNSRGVLLHHSFRPGDTVRLSSGPLGGMEAIFQGPTKPSERVRVLIEFLGRLREAEVDIDALEHSNTAPIAPRARRTRGKGRVIKY
jgi:transcriptional antiterminator RfaH